MKFYVACSANANDIGIFVLSLSIFTHVHEEGHSYVKYTYTHLINSNQFKSSLKAADPLCK